MNRILFPTDFSKNADHALAYCIQLAQKLEATIDLMHVFHLSMNEAASLSPHLVNESIKMERNGLIEQLKQLRQNAPKGIIKNVRVDYGVFVHQELIDAARSDSYDLICMGTKGKHNFVEKVLGSVTSNTMMNVSCPVLAIPESASFQKIQRIAYANDFHPNHQEAVAQLSKFAENLSASLHFVHVRLDDDSKEIESFNIKAGKPYQDFSLIDDVNIMDGLQRFVEEKNIDVLSLFIPKRRLWERLFHFSVSKNLSFQTNIPLLSFHE